MRTKWYVILASLFMVVLVAGIAYALTSNQATPAAVSANAGTNVCVNGCCPGPCCIDPSLCPFGCCPCDSCLTDLSVAKADAKAGAKACCQQGQ